MTGQINLKFTRIAACKITHCWTFLGVPPPPSKIPKATGLSSIGEAFVHQKGGDGA